MTELLCQTPEDAYQRGYERGLTGLACGCPYPEWHSDRRGWRKRWLGGWADGVARAQDIAKQAEGAKSLRGFVVARCPVCNTARKRIIHKEKLGTYRYYYTYRCQNGHEWQGEKDYTYSVKRARGLA